ncbi:hypothetical protein [Actinoplanes rectilineatus]|uniref:hypothetical protein n=1 Tax=Actinoplanes rectilineatus TaxID=113571 RepID=UPI000A5CA69C|nr:hypothetical protein [Actinoplanes rectilineatus]
MPRILRGTGSSPRRYRPTASVEEATVDRRDIAGEQGVSPALFSGYAHSAVPP